ncbi:unnamed protein product [Lampetra fluviatilis]
MAPQFKQGRVLYLEAPPFFVVQPNDGITCHRTIGYLRQYVNMWALGCVVVEIALGKLLFKVYNFNDLFPCYVE